MSQKTCKRILLACAILLVAVALLVTLFVIPEAGTDSSAGAVPEMAVRGFGMNVGLSLLAAAGCAAVAVWSRRRRWTSTSLLVLVGLVVLGLGLALIDAGAAYRSHEGVMRSMPTLLFVDAALDIAAGAAVFAVAFLRVRT